MAVSSARFSVEHICICMTKSVFTILNCSTPRLAKAAELGLLEYLRRKWFPEKPGCQGDQTTVNPVSLELVQTAFVMAAAGLVVAAMLLSLECLLNSHSHRQRQRQRQTDGLTSVPHALCVSLLMMRFDTGVSCKQAQPETETETERLTD